MHQAYRNQGRWKVQQSVGGMGALEYRRPFASWTAKLWEGGIGPLAPQYRRSWHMSLEIFDKSSSGDTKFEFFKGYFAIWVIICSFDPLIHLILEINEYFI